MKSLGFLIETFYILPFLELFQAAQLQIILGSQGPFH